MPFLSRARRGGKARSKGRRSSSTLVEARARRGYIDRRMQLQSIYFDPFPSIMKNRLRYVDNIIVQTVNTSDDASVHYFACNGIHDPNITGGGHQPYGHDTLASLYNHYVVEKATIRVTPSTIAGQIIWGVAVTDDNVTPVTDNVMQERKLGKSSVMAVADHVVPEALYLEWKADASFPVHGATQKNMNAAYGSNPGELMCFCVWARRALVGLSSASVSFNVEIEYYVSSYELKQLDQN